MDYSSLIPGILGLCFGLFTLGARLTGKMDNFSKLRAMKELYGEKKGNLVHLIGYTIVPLVLGVVLIALSFLGKAAE